jgi:hypothetical protein
VHHVVMDHYESTYKRNLQYGNGYREYIDHNNDEPHVQHEQYESNNIVLNEPFLDQALVTQVPTPEPRLLATLKLPLAGRSFSTDSQGAALEKWSPMRRMLRQHHELKSFNGSLTGAYSGSNICVTCWNLLF